MLLGKLDKLKKLHDELKNDGIFHQYYKRLNGKQSKNHWERMISCIEAIIKNHLLNNKLAMKIEIKKLEKEISDAHEKTHETSLTYITHLLSWWNDLSKKKSSEIAAEIAKEYNLYQQKKPTFFKDIELKKEHKKQDAQYKIDNPQKRDPNSYSLTSIPLDVLKYILTFSNKKTLGRVAQISHRMNMVANDPLIWKFMLEKEKKNNMTFDKANSFFKSSLKGDIVSPKKEFKKTLHELKQSEKRSTAQLMGRSGRRGK